jgi:phage shock protein A
MTEPSINRNLADKRKEIQAYIGSLERDLEQARRDLSAIIATERVFQSKGSTRIDQLPVFRQAALLAYCWR